jgi:hypothetical protein
MKIGILTFHRAHNYGAMLQAYALHSTLTQMGHDVEFIDYRQEQIERAFDLHDKSVYIDASLANKIKIFLSRLITFNRRKLRAKRFMTFMRKYLSTSSSYNQEQLLNTVLDYNVVVFGSDQIWTTRFLRKFDRVLWGDIKLKSGKKISYAPSMEMASLSNEQTKFCKEHLQNFDCISVRENRMYSLLSPLTDKQISVVLDPVFLCQRYAYEGLATESMIQPPKKYVLLYTIGLPDNNILEIARSVSENIEAPLISICGYVGQWYDSSKKETAGPCEFISLFLNALFVVTSTFHGTAFSVLFEKDFLSIKAKGISGRAESLLQNLGLEDRLISTKSDIVWDKISLIDYREPKIKLSKLRNESLRYLKESIK